MKKLTNPNFIYIITFLIPFLVYSLAWSTIYPVLTNNLLIFYIITFVIALILGVFIDHLPGVNYKKIPAFPLNIPVIVVMFFFYVLDCWYAGFVPLFKFTEDQNVYQGGQNFGIPTFHVLLITFNIFFAVYCFHQFLSNRTWKMLFIYLSTFLPFIFLLQRSSIMYIVIASAFVFFLSQKKLAVTKLVSLIAIMLLAIYSFGYLGNLRSGSGDPTFILRFSGATDKFIESPVPKEFYWGYLYIASPVANLQNNINIEKNVQPDNKGFILFEMIPDFLAKKIAGVFSLQRREFNQINSFLNVGTIYARPFSYFSWAGMLIIFIYLMLLANIYYVVIRKSFKYGTTGIALVCTMVAMANFDNSITYSPFSFPLVYPLVFSILQGIRVKVKRPASSRVSIA